MEYLKSCSIQQLLETISKKNDISQVDATIESSTASGMISMDQYAKKLIDKGVINTKDVEWMLKKDQTN